MTWILRNKATKEAIMETSDPRKVAALNTAKYEAVTVGQHLGELNAKLSAANKQAGPRFGA